MGGEFTELKVFAGENKESICEMEVKKVLAVMIGKDDKNGNGGGF